MATVGAVDSEAAIRSINDSFERLAIGARRSIRSAAAMLAPDLQPAAWPVFGRIIRAERIQASTIVSSLGMDKSAVSRHVKELRALGLVDVERDEHDARVLWITPTPLALGRAATVLEDQRTKLRGALETWSAADVERFAELLDRFSQRAALPEE